MKGMSASSLFTRWTCRHQVLDVGFLPDRDRPPPWMIVTLDSMMWKTEPRRVVAAAEVCIVPTSAVVVVAVYVSRKQLALIEHGS